MQPLERLVAALKASTSAFSLIDDMPLFQVGMEDLAKRLGAVEAALKDCGKRIGALEAAAKTEAAAVTPEEPQ